MVDKDKVEKIAGASTFYVQGDLWLRIDYVSEGAIHVHNENTGDEYLIDCEDVNLDTDKFYRLVEVDPSEEIQ